MVLVTGESGLVMTQKPKLLPHGTPEQERAMTDEELIARLRGRSQFCKDRGEVKSPDLMNEAVDRIELLAVTNEALTEQLAAAQHDAKEAEAYAEELEADRKKTYEALLKVSRIHGEVEEKLAKAVEALRFYAWENEMRLPSDGPWGADSTDFGKVARATLAEIKGESHE